MAPSVQEVAQVFGPQIFEDPEPQRRGRKGNHSRTPSIADALRRRQKENCSPTKSQKQPSPDAVQSASPLGERHINSPPPPKRVVTKSGDGPSRPSRPTHK